MEGLDMDNVLSVIDNTHNKKKITKETIRQTIDYETGEITHEVEEKEAMVGNEPNYIKLYLDNITALNGLTKGSSDILFQLLKYMSYDNLIILNPFIKQKIQEELGLKNMQSLNNAISKLTKRDILQNVGRGTYRANPFILGKGKWQDIKKIRLTVEIEKDKIIQKPEFEYEESVEE